jgi:hypothetical protein
MALVANQLGLKAFGRFFNERGYNTLRLQDPAGHMAYRMPRLCNDDSSLGVYVNNLQQALQSVVEDKKELDLKDWRKYRVMSAIKLQKYNPLHLAIVHAAQSNGYEASYEHQDSFLSRSGGETARTVGRSRLYVLRKGEREYLVNGVFIGRSYGSDHKADEWSARRRALDYQWVNEHPQVNNWSGSVFVIDGNWHEKAIQKLYCAGWDSVCRVKDLNSVIEKWR